MLPPRPDMASNTQDCKQSRLSDVGTDITVTEMSSGTIESETSQGQSLAQGQVSPSIWGECAMGPLPSGASTVAFIKELEGSQTPAKPVEVKGMEVSSGVSAQGVPAQGVGDSMMQSPAVAVVPVPLILVPPTPAQSVTPLQGPSAGSEVGGEGRVLVEVVR